MVKTQAALLTIQKWLDSEDYLTKNNIQNKIIYIKKIR